MGSFLSLQGRPYSCQKLIEARKLQKALFTYLGSERNVETETLEEQTLCLCRFLKSYVCILSAAEWTAHSMGDDVGHALLPLVSFPTLDSSFACWPFNAANTA